MVARIVSSRTDAEVSLADAYGALKGKLPGAEAVRHLREDAFGAFAAAGLPNRRIEAWHYTDLRNLVREVPPVAPRPADHALAAINQDLTGRPGLGGGRLVIVDGTFVPALSDAPPEGASVRSLADVLGEGREDLVELLAAKGYGGGDAMLALNAAMMQDGRRHRGGARRRARRADRDRLRDRARPPGLALLSLARRGRRRCKGAHH